MRISDWSSDVCSSDLRFSTSSSSTINSELRVTRNWYAPLTCIPGNISATNSESTEDRKTKSCSPPETFFGSWMMRGSERGARTSARRPLRPNENGRAHVRTTVTNAQPVCSLQRDKKKKQITYDK